MSAAAKALALSFRPMLERDLDEVLDIETTVYDFPWSVGIFRDCLSHGDYCLLMEQEGYIVGYGVLSMVAGDAHILNLCIKPNSQNRGLGQQFLCYLMTFARRCGGHVIFLEARPSNWRALRIYKKLGFYEVGTRRDYYRAKIGREDALILARQLNRS